MSNDLHAPMGAAEAKTDRGEPIGPHFTEHPEKKDRVPRPLGDYFTGNEKLADAPEVHDRVPANPQGADGFTEHPDKVATQGHADHRKARGRDYKESKVEDAAAHNRSEHVPINEDAGSISKRQHCASSQYESYREHQQLWR